MTLFPRSTGRAQRDAMRACFVSAIMSRNSNLCEVGAVDERMSGIRRADSA